MFVRNAWWGKRTQSKERSQKNVENEDEDLSELKATWLDARDQHKGMTDSRFEKLRSDFLFGFIDPLIVSDIDIDWWCLPFHVFF